MPARIYYYTGTGNSLWVARLAAAALGGAELQPVVGAEAGAPGVSVDATGLVFPVHMWGVPGPVVRFAGELDPGRAGYVFAFAVDGGQPAGALLQLDRILRRRGGRLSAGFSIAMPPNYTPLSGPGTSAEREGLYEAARVKIGTAAASVGKRLELAPERGGIAGRVAFGAIYRMTYGLVPRMDRFFRADDTCNGCGVCERVCPARNVTILEGRPVWQGRCEQCFACLHWCPEQAIQFGGSTRGRERYHHPEVSRQDMTDIARRLPRPQA
jgi:ferredoxin